MSTLIPNPEKNITKSRYNKFKFQYERFYMHNKFSNFCCLASYFAHMGTISKNYNSNDEKRVLGK